MTVTAFLASVRTRVGDVIHALGTRGAWCRKQRILLGAPGGSVVWVRSGALAWAEWGARRGYFEIQFMDGLPYLRALGAPAV